jgi:hypothetical protein
MLPGPAAGQVYLGGRGPVWLYDLGRREVVAEGLLPFAGLLFYDATRQWLFAGDFNQSETPGSGRVVAVDALSFRRLWDMRVVPPEAEQDVRFIGVSAGGRDLYVTSAAPIPFRLGEDGRLYVVEIDGQLVRSTMQLEGNGRTFVP